MPWLEKHGTTYEPSSSCSRTRGRKRSMAEAGTSSRYERWMRDCATGIRARQQVSYAAHGSWEGERGAPCP